MYGHHDYVTQANFRTMVTREVTNDRERTMGNGTGFYTEDEMKIELKWSKSLDCKAIYGLDQKCNIDAVTV